MKTTRTRKPWRRWTLLDTLTAPDGRRDVWAMGRFRTRRGALFRHWWIATLLLPRGGRATILLHDRETGHTRRLSTQ